MKAQERLLRANVPLLGSDVASALKDQADNYLWSDIHRSQDTAQLLFVLAEISGDPLHHALGLLAQANAYCIGLAEYEKAIELYDRAAEIYGSHGRAAEQARSQVGKIGALANLGRYAEALEDRAVGQPRIGGAGRVADPGHAHHEPGHRLQPRRR